MESQNFAILICWIEPYILIQLFFRKTFFRKSFLNFQKTFYICSVLFPESPTRVAGMKRIFLKRRYFCALFLTLRDLAVSISCQNQSNIVMPGGMYYFRPVGLLYT